VHHLDVRVINARGSCLMFMGMPVACCALPVDGLPSGWKMAVVKVSDDWIRACVGGMPERLMRLPVGMVSFQQHRNAEQIKVSLAMRR